MPALTAQRDELGRLRTIAERHLARQREVDALSDPLIDFLQGACDQLRGELLGAAQQQLTLYRQRLASRIPVPDVSDLERGGTEESATAEHEYAETKDALMKVITLCHMEETNEERRVYDLFVVTCDVAAALEDRYVATRDGIVTIERLREACANVEGWLMAQQAKRMNTKDHP